MAEIKPTINGAIIFNAGYQGGRKLPTVSKLQQLGSQGMKSIERPKTEYENLFNNSSIGRYMLDILGGMGSLFASPPSLNSPEKAHPE